MEFLKALAALAIVGFSCSQEKKQDERQTERDKIEDILSKKSGEEGSENLLDKDDDRLERRLVFEDAKYDPSKRDEYVKSLRRLVAIPDYVESIEYVKRDFQRPRDKIYAGRDPVMLSNNISGKIYDIGKGMKTRISIFDAAFENSKSEKAFSMRFRHELNNAKIIHKGFDNIPLDYFRTYRKDGSTGFNSTLLHIAAELESYSGDLDYARRFMFSAKEIEMTREHYMRYYRMLWAKGSKTKEGTMDNLKKLFFRDWMKNYPIYHTDEQGAYLKIENRILRIPK
ncbi:hypothetical protein KY345_03705 [Candidatus Woesearchaeota archaeon]|nr:hypothetical protein [Candidatus Woesearchaeota archaeon]